MIDHRLAPSPFGLDHTNTVPRSRPDHSRRVGRVRRVGRASSRGPPECRCLPRCVLAAVNCPTTPATSPAPAVEHVIGVEPECIIAGGPRQRRVAGRGEVIDPDEVEHPRGTCERASACGPSTPCQRPRSHRTGPPRMTHNYKCFHLHTPQSSPMKWWPYEWKILGPRMEHGWNTDSEGKSEMRHKSQPRSLLGCMRAGFPSV